MTEIFSRDPRWNGPALTDLRASLEKPASQESAAPPRPKPTESQIAGLLADPDPNRRAEGLAAAGRHQVEAFHAKVLDTALAGDGIERQAAIYALGLYGRDVPEPALRRLLASDDIGLRFLAVELATRRDAARFAAETMELVRAVVALAAKAKAGDWTRQSLRYLPRIVCRLARGPIPQSMLDGLSDADPTVRRITVQALELSGNPDAVRSLEPLTRDPDPATREASRVALLYLGPAGD
jgi:HEAT repeat protein